MFAFVFFLTEKNRGNSEQNVELPKQVGGVAKLVFDT